ncbi:hypothetical protein LP419_35345 [Massilia sp. H-1]|nr:hypothetical protein LP419_35345 [Massilia sp. H-1]
MNCWDASSATRSARRPARCSPDADGDNAVRRLTAPDGRHYTAFVRRTDQEGALRGPPPGFGARPMGPPPDGGGGG